MPCREWEKERWYKDTDLERGFKVSMLKIRNLIYINKFSRDGWNGLINTENRGIFI